MDEVTIVVVVLLIVLGIVTVVGHGIWVLIARIFGGATSNQHSQHARGDDFDRGPSECPRCHSPLELFQRECTICGWPRAAWSPAGDLASLRALRRQVELLGQRGALDAEARAELYRVLQEQEERLRAQNAAAVESVPSDVVELTPAESLESPVLCEPPMAATEAVPPPVETTPAHVAAPLGERARKFAASRATMTVGVEPEELAAPLVEPPRREAFSRLLAAFMEEKNIRWGELVGGLLIVGCSIALVISFWSQIAARPVLKFVLFNGVTAALFGVGMYTDRRWKIHTTSHGLLAIATLLVPLNFLAIAAFTQASPPTDVLSLAGEGLTLVVFALLVYFAGRILVPDEPVVLAVGVIVPCLMQLLVRRFAHEQTPLAETYVLAGVPVVSYLLAAGYVIYRRWQPASSCDNPAADGDERMAVAERDNALTEVDANRTLLFLGLVSAATIMPLALLLHHIPPLMTALHWLAPLATACGLPALLTGLLFWRRLTDLEHSTLQTSGVGVGVLGALIMVGAVVVAWPDPATLAPTALVTAAVMIAVAILFGIPAAHIPAGIALSAAWLTIFYVLRGRVDWVVDDAATVRTLFLSATSGHALVPVVAVCGVVAVVLSRIRRRDAARMYGIVAAFAMVVSLALVVAFGFARIGDPQNATWTLAIYTVAALLAALVLQRQDAAYAASSLLLATLAQAIVYRFNPTWHLVQPLGIVLLLHAFFVVSLCAILQFVRTKQLDESPYDGALRVEVLRALSLTTHVTAFAAAAWMMATCAVTPVLVLSIRLAVLGLVWLMLAVLNESAVFFTASQLGLVLAIFCGVTAVVEKREWYAMSPRPWLDPWFIEVQGIALAFYCLLRSGMSWWLERGLHDRNGDVLATPPPRWRRVALRMIQPPWPAVDDCAAMVVAVLLLIIAVYAVLPGAAQELSSTQTVGSRVVAAIGNFEIAGIPHAHAAGVGAWLLLTAVAMALAPRLARLVPDWMHLVAAAVGMLACMLLAARLDAQVAVASGLRWYAAALLAIGTVAAWLVESKLKTSAIGSAGNALLASDRASFALPSGASPRDLLVAFNLLVYVVMGVYVAQAALWQEVNSSAGASRGAWLFCVSWAIVGGIVAALLFLANAGKLQRENAAKHPFVNVEAWAGQVRWVALLAAIAPLGIVLMFTVAKVLDALPLVGPDPASWFRRIGFEWNYGVPLALIAVTFVGFAVRDRSAGYGFAAGLLFNLVATIVVLLRLARGGGVLDATAWIVVAQVNTLVAGIVAAVWMAGDQWQVLRSRVAPVRPRELPLLLIVQVALAGALCASYMAPTTVRLAIAGLVPGWVAEGGTAAGWCGLVLAIATAGWLRRERGVSQWYVAAAAAGLIGAVGVTILGRGWSYPPHALLAGCCVAAWITPTITWFVNELLLRKASGFDASAIVGFDYGWAAPPVRLFDMAAAALAVWELWTVASWWIVAALVAIAARNLVVAWREGRRGSVWLAAVLSAVAVSVWWLSLRRMWATMFGPGEFWAFLWVHVLAAGAIALASVLIERRHAGGLHASESVRQRWGIAFHRFAAWAMVAVFIFTVGTGLVADLWNQPLSVNLNLAWAAWLATAIVAAACTWDPAIRWPIPCLYCVGLVAVALYLDGLDLQAPLFHWALANALASYSVITSGLWCERERLRGLFTRLGISLESATAMEGYRVVDVRAGHSWLVTANLLVGIGVLLLVFWIEQVMPSFVQRMVAAYAVGGQAVAIGLLARGAARTKLQYTTLVWGVLFAMAFGWAWVPPDFAVPWLHRFVVTIAALAAMVVVYGFGLVKLWRRENEWTQAAQRLVPALALLATAFVFVVLATEILAYIQHGEVPIAPAALVTVIVALAGLAVASLTAALVPGRDPLGLSERGRTAYVYAAEVLGSLLFVHIRVTMPWLFSGWFMRFWPLIVMALAFLGVGLGEVFQRRKQRVLSEPLETSGAILPLLPALGFWVKSSAVDYSLLLLSIGVLYAGLGILRRSFSYGVLAAVAANGSLWYFLHRQNGLDFTEHPQLWLIPPALCALAAGYINRTRLSDQQAATLRYGAAIVIYVSSTADIFISGVTEAPWLPGVLAGISIVGVLAGIMLRVRAFLYLGTAFLVVAIMTIIWHAAEEHTWIWWLAGIITGVLIIALFGVFEKRREDVLRMVEELKHWQS